jgi:hypothetical protein
MALERSLAELITCLQNVQDVLSASRLTITEDQPTQSPAAIADVFVSGIDDALGYAHDALEGAVAARKAVNGPLDFDRARRYLGKSQEAFHRVADCYFSHMVAYERLTELERLAAERRGEWQAWAKSVKVSLDECGEPIEAANRTFISCWEHLTEALTNALSLRPRARHRAEPQN